MTPALPSPERALEAPGLSWSGTVDYGPGPLHAPTSPAELQELVGRSPQIRALGTRHSFSEVAASDGPQIGRASCRERV